MSKTKKSFRGKVDDITSKPVFIISIVFIGLLLSLVSQIGTLLFYIAVFITLWAKKWDWKYFGITKPDWPNTILRAVLFTIVIFLLIDFLIQPVIELCFGKVDISGLSSIQGNLFSYLIFILLGWIMGGFCEEIIYRGYIMKRLAIIFGDTNISWILSAIIASLLFGLAHTYQGLAGIITTGTIALLFGLIFIFNRTNLLLLVLIHGIYNTISITLIYLGKERVITDWVKELIK